MKGNKSDFDSYFDFTKDKLMNISIDCCFVLIIIPNVLHWFLDNDYPEPDINVLMLMLLSLVLLAANQTQLKSVAFSQ